MGTSIKVWWKKVLAWLRGDGDEGGSGTGSGGTGGTGEGVTRPLPTIGGGKTLTGYGRVNAWASAGREVLRRDLEACAAAGVAIYTIEMAGWANTSVFGNAKRMADCQALYAWLVGECRRLGLWLLVSIVNDNAGSRKYGDNGVALKDAIKDSEALAECVRRNGPANVLVQPVAETSTEQGKRFERYCVTLLKGFVLVNNAGSRPASAGGMRYFAWHPFKMADIAGAPEGALVVSDTGSIIIELGGSYDGPGNPAALKRYVAAGKARGCLAVVYYAFKREAHDAAAITAMGDGFVPMPADEPQVQPGAGGDELDLAKVNWLGPDIRAWPITSILGTVKIGKNVEFPHSMAGRWPEREANGVMCEANCWLIASVGGRWFAASFEWLRPGQTSKPVKTLGGDHCKAAPLSGSWRPKSGDVLYFAVAGLSRGTVRNVSERTAFRRAVYP